ncbi:hypothetical protein HDU98_007572 [Podochytrium sp. JEL0797]|nr:hypothetical protein HDU98_007572 [Podochytrium sp. JEL0797]
MATFAGMSPSVKGKTVAFLGVKDEVPCQYNTRVKDEGAAKVLCEEIVKDDNTQTKLIVIHGLCMFLAFAVLPVVGVFVARHLQKMPYWMYLHGGIHLLLVALVVLGLYTTFSWDQARTRTPIDVKFHRWFGTFEKHPNNVHNANPRPIEEEAEIKYKYTVQPSVSRC